MSFASLFSVALVLLAVPAQAGDAPTTARNVLERAGVRAQIEELDELAIREFMQHTPPLSSSERERVVDQIRASVDGADSLERIESRLGETAAEVDSLAAWLRSPLGAKVARLETAAAAPAGRRSFLQFLRRFDRERVPSGRIALLAELDAQTGATDQSMALGYLLRTEIGASAPRREQVRLRTLARLLFTYRDLSDAELAQYLDHLRTPSAEWLHLLTRQAVHRALAPATRVVGAQVRALEQARDPDVATR
jgi:hypothetical protein